MSKHIYRIIAQVKWAEKPYIVYAKAESAEAASKIYATNYTDILSVKLAY